MRTFIRIVDTNSFTRAAESLDIPRATATTIVQNLEASLRHATDNLTGRLRIEMPGAVASAIVLPALDDFHTRYPNLDLAIGISNRTVDLITEAIDCSIQLGELPDSNLIARQLGTLEHVTCASPAYLARNGTPSDLDDLRGHVAVNCMSPHNGREVDFDFEVDGEAQKVKVKGFVKVSDE